jgi:CBS domain-containing protein
MGDEAPATQCLPVRKRLTVIRPDRTSSDSIVFCDPQQRSVPLGRCTSCPFGGPVEHRGGLATVPCSRCALPMASSDDAPGAPRASDAVCSIAAALPIGLVLVRPVVCVAQDMLLRDAAAALDAEPSAFGVPVVDGDERLVGMLPRATAALALMDGGHEQPVASRMTSFPSLPERESISVAFSTMGARRAREVAIVDRDRRVVGTLRDIDALRFVAYVARTGLRPPRARAA